MHLLTDSNSLFDIVSEGYQTSEKKVMFDVEAGREAHLKREISNIRLVKSSANIADGFRKSKIQYDL